MKNILKNFQIAGAVFAAIGGVLLHYLYDLTDKSIIVAPFSAVNESIWEHMKLLLFPMFIFALAEYKFIGKDYRKYWCIKLAGIITGLLLITVIYYTYTGVFGINADWFNIVIFFIAAGTTYYLEYRLLSSKTKHFISPLVSFAALCFIALIFMVLTFVPPKIPLFRDMMTGAYGISA